MIPTLRTDDRGMMSPVAHSMTIAITSLLVVGLLLGATGLLDSQQDAATREELRTVGERIATDISHVDSLAQDGGTANATSRHVSDIAGSTYSVSLERGTDDCDTSRLPWSPGDPPPVCLRLASTDRDATQYVPVDNESAIHLDSGLGGVFYLSAEREPASTEFSTRDRLDLNTRGGVGRDVSPNGVVLGSEPGNRPPVAKFTFSPGSPQEGQPVTFDASRSRDPDGDVEEYFWDWDDDGVFDDSTSSPIITHTFSAGTYNVSLRVEDDVGSTSNFTQFIDVSGLVYNRDLDTTGSSSVKFSLTNNFGQDVELTHVMVDPLDDSIDHIDNGGDAEIAVDADDDGGHDEWYPIELHDGGRIVELEDTAEINAGSTTTVEIRGFEDSVDGEWLNLGVQYLVNGTPNSTRFSGVPGSPSIDEYQVTANGTDVDLSFESTHELDDVEIEIGGSISRTIDEGDLTETTASLEYEYSYDISNGTAGYFWANMTTAASSGDDATNVPVNDSAVTVTGGYVWASAADWDGFNESLTRGVVHDSFGSHTADRLELGYPAFDRGGDNLVGYWPLDDTTDAVDASGTGNDGAVVGNPGDSIGIFGTRSYDLDGNDDHVVIPDSSSLEMADDEVTVSAWVNKDATQGGDWVAIFQHSDTSYNLQFADGNEPEFTIYDGDWYSASTNSAVTTGQWYHVVGVFDGNEVELYIDGAFKDSNAAPDEIDPASTDAGIGENVDATGRHLNGEIDEVRLYDRALSAGEVSQLYDAHAGGTLTTDWRTSSVIDGGDVGVQYDVSAASRETVRVRVHSRDGAVERSDWVTLGDGAGSVTVSGLTQSADEYRLEAELETSAPGHAPSVDTLAVVDTS